MNWFKYRLPNTDPNKDLNLNPVVSGTSDRLISGLSEGFVVAPFMNPSEGLFTIPLDSVPPKEFFFPSPSPLPPSTGFREYYDELEAIRKDLNGKRGKTVAARVINIMLNIDINATFDALCEAYPDAFVFAFSTYDTGTWIGASPELLLRVEGNKVSTMALAGTRPVSSDGEDPEWDEKNRDEQKMVEEFISDCLHRHCKDVATGHTYSKKAGPIEHICTPLSATLKSSLGDLCTSSLHPSLFSLLSSLSPTPALCGSDRQRSLKLIQQYEHFDRQYYGGFCGPSGIDGHTEFFVILRAAKCSFSEVALFVGSGITLLSDVKEEWFETDLKSKTIINKLKTSEK